MTAPFHIGIVVADLDAAMAELTRAAGLSWGEPIDRRTGEWDYRIVYSIEGPPHVELVEGAPGSPWDASEGPRLDHAGWWIDNVSAEKERLEAIGLSVDADLRPLPGGRAVYMHAPATGLRFELNDSAGEAAFYERLGRGTPPTD